VDKNPAPRSQFYTWPQSHSRPLRVTVGPVPVGPMLPYHRAVVYSSNRSRVVPPGMDYPDTRCSTDFDYDAPPGSVPDPHGCGLFRRSFSRIKTVKKCIVGKLEESPRWQQYREAVTVIRNARVRNNVEATAANPNLVTPADVESLSDPKLHEVLTGCEQEASCVLLDALRRADEMLKYLSFKDWEAQDKPLREWVAGKVRYTASIFKPDEEGKNKKHLGLEDHIVDGIVGDCLGVNADTYAELPTETRTLERSLVCNMIMWDSGEVPGAPEPPAVDANGMWDPSLGFQGEPIHDFHRTPTTCGRVAGVFAGWPQIHAPKAYSATSCTVLEGNNEDMSWKNCIDGSYFNCVCFEKCWRAALRRSCDLSPGCCGDM